MKLNVLLFLLVLAGTYQNLTAQNDAVQGTSISKFEDGKIISQDDINFLSLVLNASGTAPRGTDASSVMVGKSNLTKGSKLSAADANAIETAISNYQKNNASMVSKTSGSEPTKSRGCYRYCYYWYCDYYGNCYWYWYCC